MKKIYVVVGQTGEYSDRVDWYVCAYPTRDLAEKHEWAAKQAADKILADYSQGNYWAAIDGSSNSYDPNMQMDSGGTDYYVAEVELRETLPEIKD